MQDIYYIIIIIDIIDQTSLIWKETFYGITLVPKKYQLYMFLKIKDVIKESQYSTKIKYISLIHFQEELIFEIQQSHVDQKTAKMLYIKPRRRQILPTHTISNTNATTKNVFT